MVVFKKLKLLKRGNPSESLSLVDEDVSEDLKAGQAIIKVLASPINPSDYLTLLGIYPAKLQESVPGLEGVAEVVKSSTGNFLPGDRVFVASPGWGLWKEGGVIDEANIIKMDKSAPAEILATLLVNPCTAYLMVKKIVQLEKGDAIIQNGANSSVGVAVIQMAKLFGFKTINVIRNRANLAETVKTLKDLGADAVITYEDLKGGLEKLNLGLPAPKLCFECIGGECVGDMSKALANGGTMAIYGVITGQPAHVPQTDIIFRDIKYVGFWLNMYIPKYDGGLPKLLADVLELYTSGKIKPPTFRKFKLDQWKEAIELSNKGFTNEKVLFDMTA